jgi:hypothetical protein
VSSVLKPNVAFSSIIDLRAFFGFGWGQFSHSAAGREGGLNACLEGRLELLEIKE